MAETRATINQITMESPMSMNEMEFDIQGQGFFEKDTTVRDKTLRTYFGNEIAYEQGETASNVVYDKNGNKYSFKGVGIAKKIELGSSKKWCAIYPNRFGTFYCDKRNLEVVFVDYNGNELRENYILTLYNGSVTFFETSSSVVCVSEYKGQFTLVEYKNGSLWKKILSSGGTRFEGKSFLSVYPSAINGVWLISVIKEMYREPTPSDLWCYNVGLKFTPNGWECRVANWFGGIDENTNIAIWTGYNFISGRTNFHNFLAVDFSGIRIEPGTNDFRIRGVSFWHEDTYAPVITFDTITTAPMTYCRYWKRNNGSRMCTGEKRYQWTSEPDNYWENYIDIVLPYIETDKGTMYSSFGTKVGEQGATILYNNDMVSSIGWRETLLEPMFSVNKVYNWWNKLVYEQNDKFYYISIESEPYTCKLIDNRYIISNKIDTGGESDFPEYMNAYDLETKTFFNAFNDWNNRAIPQGEYTNTPQYLSFVSANKNGLYENNFGQSWCPPVTMLKADYTANTIKLKVPSNDIYKINIYTGSNTLPEYKETYYSEILTPFQDTRLLNTYYYGENTAGLYYFGDVKIGDGVYFTKGKNNAYELLQKEGMPILVYNTLLSLGNFDEFFTLRKQAFIIRNNNIYSVTFNNGVISDIEFVLPLGANKMIGNTPEFVLFYNESLKQVYLFQGDSSMELLFYAYKLKGIKQVLRNQTEMGIVIVCQDRVFYVQGEDIFSRPIANCENVYFTDRGIYYLCSDTIVFETVRDDILSNEFIKPLHIKTAYIGTGRNELAENNCWYITLYNRHGKENGSVKVIGRCINTSSLTQREKELHLTMQDFTEEGLCFIRFQPQVQNTVGTSIEIISDYDIQYLALGYMPQGIQQITKINL